MNVEVKLYSISEVSELTGVNSVTLRAWQRRYGLLVPQRTPKGHRLYTDNDIAKIHDILAWLDKGVSIGKVKPLLEGAVEHQQPDVEKIELVEETLSFIEQGKLQQVENRLREALKLYPFKTLEEQFLQPIEDYIARTENPLKALHMSIWNTVVVQCFVSIFGKVNAEKNTPCLVMSYASINNHHVWQQALKLAYDGNYVTVLCDISGKLTGLSSLLQDQQIKAMYIVGENKLDNKQLAEIESLISECDITCEFIGSIKNIHQGEFGV
ncbi:MerR family transcriptional regulator [Photobacterium leiognathi]|uniref:MerR family transcriptional regulator n=1 Tax=Photobacterium leiognathi TaxID=553611 RepID=UPI00273409DF|nr:MerR family transcriptional regulator [Photobacterium leiognathi]